MKTPEEFRAFYAAIPEYRWCVEYFQKSGGQCCAIGFLGIKDSDDYESSQNDDVLAVKRLFEDYDLETTIVNDGEDSRFQQSTPKQRILAALDWIIQQQKQTT